MFLTIVDPRFEIRALYRAGLSPREFARRHNATAQLPNERIIVLRRKEPDPEGFIRSALNWLLKRFRELFGPVGTVHDIFGVAHGKPLWSEDRSSQVDKPTREKEALNRFLRNRYRAAFYRS